jgi:N-acetylmuramoyl-L-alanine amidase
MCRLKQGEVSMKKSQFSPLMVAGLVLVMVLAGGCERPDQQAVLETPVPVGPQVQATLPPAVAPTATLPAGEMPPDLALTMAAPGPEPVATLPAPAGAAEATPLPALPEPTAAPLVVSTPVPPTAVPATLAPLSPTGGLHTVQPGERLFSIARLYNVNPYAIAQLNAIPAPYLIYPGQQLKIPGTGSVPPAPPPSGATSYTVLPGDSLFRIALRLGKSMQSIAAANGIVNYNLIYPGQVLRIP